MSSVQALDDVGQERAVVNDPECRNCDYTKDGNGSQHNERAHFVEEHNRCWCKCREWNPRP